MQKIVKIVITIILIMLGIFILYYGISKSDFSNLKKYDSKGSKKTHSTANFKEDVANGLHYKTEVTMESENMANLGDFTINIAGNKKLITNISLELKSHKIVDWLSDNSLQKEVLKKGVILRNTVITDMSGRDIAMNSERVKKALKKSLNKDLSEGQVVEVYFNKFIIQ